MRKATSGSRPEPRTSVKLVRCAVYTRKSSEEGLEQEFNSLDAQREAGEAFIRSQAGEGGLCSTTGSTTADTPACPRPAGGRSGAVGAVGRSLSRRRGPRPEVEVWAMFLDPVGEFPHISKRR